MKHKSAAYKLKLFTIMPMLFLIGCTHGPFFARGEFVEPYTLECGANPEALFHAVFRIEGLENKVSTLSAERRLAGGYIAEIPVESYVCQYTPTLTETVCGSGTVTTTSRFSFIFKNQIGKETPRQVVVRLPNFSGIRGDTAVDCKRQ